jgi:hypothetical protein
MFAPMVPKLILDIFCVPCTPEGGALFWEWKFISLALAKLNQVDTELGLFFWV